MSATSRPTARHSPAYRDVGDDHCGLRVQVRGPRSTALTGSPGGGGSDYASFVCAGVPAFSLSSLSWAYSPYTWHTNLDTFDKLVMDDVMNNATLTAMLVYLASEEDEMLPRDQRILGTNPRTGEPRTWPQCRGPARSGERYFNR